MWIAAIIYFGLMPTIMVLCGAWLTWDYRRVMWFKRFGHLVKAEIVNRRAILSTRPQFLFVTYRYEIDQPNKHDPLSYTREQRVTWQIYKKLKATNTVDIVYAPDMPQNSQLASQDRYYIDRLTAIFLGLVTGIIWFGLLIQFLQAFQQ